MDNREPSRLSATEAWGEKQDKCPTRTQEMTSSRHLISADVDLVSIRSPVASSAVIKWGMTAYDVSAFIACGLGDV